MLSNNVTVCIFAWNEETRILRCIDNFKHTFKMLVVDNFSIDNTVGMVRQAGQACVSIKNPGFIETPEVMEPLMAACTTDYLLIASVSEFVPLALQQEYARVADSGSYDVVRAYRVSITAGEPVPISGKPRRAVDGDIRFFKKGAVSYLNNQVHGRGTPVCSDERILNAVMNPSLHFYQFRDYDCSKTESVHCRYDDVLAEQRFDAGERFSWSRALYGTFRSFFASYLRSGSYRYGMLGFLHCYYRAHMEFTVWLRIWEWENGYTRPDVIERNSDVRASMEARLTATFPVVTAET